MTSIFDNYDLPCSGCSNEPVDKIPLARIIHILDQDYSKNDLVAAERHLSYWMKEASALRDRRSELSLCNEMIGLCRRTNDKTLAFTVIDRAVELIDALSITNTTSAGTVFLNAATTYKHFGEVEKALLFYQKTEIIYAKLLPCNAYEYAALYNNKAAVLEDLERYDEAEALLQRALSILEECDEYRIDKAISYVNLARLVFSWKQDNELADRYLDYAWEVLTDPGIAHDGMYAFVCAKASDEFASLGREDEAFALAEVAKEIYEGT